MNDCQSSLFSWGDTSIAWIAQHLRHDWLTPLMIFFSELGQVGAILFTLGFSFWLWNKHFARTLIYGLFLNIYLNIWIKNLVKECRPPSSFWLQNVDSYSFPSGHSQVGVYLWFGLAYFIKEKWLSISCLFVGTLIALSRSYLGVHYLQDITAGAAIGIAVLTLTITLEKKNFNPLGSWLIWQRAIVLLILLATYNYFIQDARGAQISATGACFGFWLGFQLEKRFVHFTPPRELWPFVGRALLGGAGLILFWKGGDMLRHQLSSNIATNAKYLQYFLVGFWVSFGAPFLYQVSRSKQ